MKSNLREAAFKVSLFFIQINVYIEYNIILHFPPSPTPFDFVKASFMFLYWKSYVCHPQIQFSE